LLVEWARISITSMAGKSPIDGGFSREIIELAMVDVPACSSKPC